MSTSTFPLQGHFHSQGNFINKKWKSRSHFHHQGISTIWSLSFLKQFFQQWRRVLKAFITKGQFYYKGIFIPKAILSTIHGDLRAFSPKDHFNYKGIFIPKTILRTTNGNFKAFLQPRHFFYRVIWRAISTKTDWNFRGILTKTSFTDRASSI